MPRALLLVLDSVGCGGAEDADRFDDAGADTLGHLALACAKGLGDRQGLRAGPLRLPHLDALGLGLAAEASTGVLPPGLTPKTGPARCGVLGSSARRARIRPPAIGKSLARRRWTLGGIFQKQSPVFRPP